MMMSHPVSAARRLAMAGFTLAALGLFGVDSARAQASNSALSFLGLGAGARAAALSGAVSGWIGDATAAYWNPAGISRLEGWDISGTHTEWLSDIRYEQVSVARNHGANGFALSFGTAYAGDFDARDEVGNQEVAFGFSDLSLGLSYARAISETFSLGITGKYWRESIDDVAADGFAGDLGLAWRTPSVAAIVLVGCVGVALSSGFVNVWQQVRASRKVFNHRRHNSFLTGVAEFVVQIGWAAATGTLIAGHVWGLLLVPAAVALTLTMYRPPARRHATT